MLPIAILAGGLATRLGNLTTHTPKSLISINGKPFIYYQLQLLREAGFNEVVLCVGNLESKIIEYVGNGSKFNLKVVYSSDGEQRLGTGGAILNAIKLLGSDFFFIYGDSYLSLDFKSMENEYFENKDFALMSIYQNKNLFDKSNVAKTHGRSIKYVKNEAKEESRLY
jgi:NDP-sugar pyrophosphorylase family protein